VSDASSYSRHVELRAEVLAAVFGVRSVTDRLEILLWQRAREPDAGRWALPGGLLLPDEDVDASARRQLAAKVDVTTVAHLEQIGVFSAPDRVPGLRTIATGFLGIVPLDADPAVPPDTLWHPMDALPPMALDHADIAVRAHQRLRGKLSYTNIGFALAPAEFTIATLRRLYTAALGHDVDPTNLQRILTRRGMLASTGTTAPTGPAGGRPAALYRFTITDLRVTDPFAAFRPPDARN
jgi:8-oxo-dGTP diphosphatase